MAKIFVIICTFLLCLITVIPLSNAQYNVIDYGAKADGKTDSTKAFFEAWLAACASTKPSTFYVPKRTFLIENIIFKGPCKAKIEFRNDGNVIAPNDYKIIAKMPCWIVFRLVNWLTIDGIGTFNGKGAGLWDCRKSGKKCPDGATSLCFSGCDSVWINAVTSIDSQRDHMSLVNCHNFNMKNVNIRAPSGSINTDAIHTTSCVGVTISNSTIMTGDDCISIGQGSKNIWIERINCGPGHGVSIGSLGDAAVEQGVENVTVTSSTFTNTQNGVRIKAWARRSNGFARDIVFQNLIMKGASNPVVIYENYCPSHRDCPHESSAIKIYRVSYKNIKGTSQTQRALFFNCTSNTPCNDIRLEDINLTIPGLQATSYCNNVKGSSTKVVSPRSCI